MNIVACVKRVPVTEAQPKIAADGKAIDATGFEYMLSFYDDLAIEEALRTKEKLGGEVTVVTLGPAEASKELRDALAKGADKALILEDAAWGARDVRSTAKALADKVKELGAEVVFVGRVATDRDNAAVGPYLATLLGWSAVTDVCKLEIALGGCTAERETEDGMQTVTFSLPAVISCDKGLNEPRYSNLKGIMAAKKKTIEQLPASDAGQQQVVIKLALPPARKAGRIVGHGAAAVAGLIDALRNEAKVL